MPQDLYPATVFARLFLEGRPDEVQAQARRLRDGQSILDTVRDQAQRMQPKLGTRDREKVDEYFTSVRELEQRMVISEEWSKKPKPLVDTKPPQNNMNSADLIGKTRLLLDLTHLALQTDSTRLVSMLLLGTSLVPPIAGVGLGIVADMALSAFGPGLVSCGSWGHKLMVGWEVAGAIGGIGAGVQGVMSDGKLDLMDAVQIGGGLMSIGGLKSTMGRCFVAGTPVGVGYGSIQIATVSPASDEDDSAQYRLGWVAVGFSMLALPLALTMTQGAAGCDLLLAPRRRGQRRRNQYTGDGMLDDDSLDDLLDNPEERMSNELWGDAPQLGGLGGSAGRWPIRWIGSAPRESSGPVAGRLAKGANDAGPAFDGGGHVAVLEEPPTVIRSQPPAYIPPTDGRDRWSGGEGNGSDRSEPGGDGASGPLSKSNRGWLMACVWTVCLVLSAFSMWKATAPGSTGSSAEVSSATSAVSLTSPGSQLLTRPIEEIRPGMRVIAQNPELDLSELDELLIEPGDWRLVTYRMEKPDGGTLTVESLALAEDGVPVGGQEELYYPELGIEGLATVTALAPCPPIESGTGRLVTSTFKHSSGDVIDLHIASERHPIGTTANHPFWSEDQHDWVQAGQLKVGERLRHYTGNDESAFQITTVTSLLPRPGLEVVYNLTVDCTHTYHVGASGVLVHNSSNYGGSAGYEATQIGGARASRGGVYPGQTKSGFRLADGTRGATGYEAKYVKGKWSDSAYNPKNYGKSAATINAYDHLVGQMVDYSRHFGKAVYMSNSKALLNEIMSIAKRKGLNNIVTRYRP